jgi:hypothetical protein
MIHMWIFDSYFKGCVELWSLESGLERISAAYPPSFYMHLKSLHFHCGMVEARDYSVVSADYSINY